MTITIIPKELSNQFAVRDQINDYILRIDTGRVVLDVVAFEWDTAVTYDLLGKHHIIRGMKVPVRFLWEAVDAFGKPSKAILADGTSFWVFNSFSDRETGKIVKLQAGNASPFICADRSTSTPY